MKNFTYAILACTAILGLSLSSCSSDDAVEVPETEPVSASSTSSDVTVLQVDGFTETKAETFSAGVSSMNCDSLNATMQATDTLTMDEVLYLLELRDTKKMGIDLFALALENYLSSDNLPRMREAHNTHKDGIERMLEFYGIEVPELTDAGVFDDVDIQARYDAAVAAMADENTAIQTLMLIKEELIVKLTADLTMVTNDNIQLLLENLVRAAQNHLCVLNSRLAEQGVTYVPSALSQADFDAIIEAGVQRGRAYSARIKMGKSNGEKGGKMNNMAAEKIQEKRQEKHQEKAAKRQGQSSDDSTDGETEE